MKKHQQRSDGLTHNAIVRCLDRVKYRGTVITDLCVLKMKRNRDVDDDDQHTAESRAKMSLSRELWIISG